MTPRDVRRYLKLVEECDDALHDMPFGDTLESLSNKIKRTTIDEQLRGHTKRRATLAAMRLMRKSRDLWRLLGGLPPFSIILHDAESHYGTAPRKKVKR